MSDTNDTNARESTRFDGIVAQTGATPEQMLDDCVAFVIEGDVDCSAHLHCWSCAEAHIDETYLAQAARTGKRVECDGVNVWPRYAWPRYKVDCVGLCCGACYEPLVEPFVEQRDETDDETDDETSI